MDVWDVPVSSCPGLDRGPLMDVGLERAGDIRLRASVERTGGENASTRIHLGVTVFRAQRTSAWARVWMGPARGDRLRDRGANPARVRGRGVRAGRAGCLGRHLAGAPFAAPHAGPPGAA